MMLEEPGSLQESLLRPPAILNQEPQASTSNSSISLRSNDSEGSSSQSTNAEDSQGTRRSHHQRRHQDLTLCIFQMTTDEEIIDEQQ